MFDRVYVWKKWLPHLKGRKCRVLARGKLNTALIEFEDGTRHVADRRAFRKLKP